VDRRYFGVEDFLDNPCPIEPGRFEHWPFVDEIFDLVMHEVPEANAADSLDLVRDS